MEPDFGLLSRVWCIAELVESRKLHLPQVAGRGKLVQLLQMRTDSKRVSEVFFNHCCNHSSLLI